MASPAHAGAINARPTDGEGVPSAGTFSTILHSAHVEFLSTLQLLAERARFLTGVRVLESSLKLEPAAM
jgi:hypothetical protein